MKINQQTSLLFWLANAKKSKKGLVPIYCRITINGLRSEFSTSKKIHPGNWQSDAGIAKGKSQESLDINRELNRIRTDLQRLYDQLESVNKSVTPDMLKNAYLGVGTKDKNIIQAFKEYNKILLKRTNAVEPTFKKKTYDRFVITQNKLEAFILYQYNQIDKKIASFPDSFGDDLLLFLTTEQNLRKNTAMKYIKNIKQMLEWAQKKEFAPKNILANFHCSYKQPKRQHLTWEEIMALYNKPMPNSRLEEVKDVYLFSCFTGYAYMDVYKLEPENVVPWIDGSKWIVKDRYKGDHNKSNVPLMEIPLACQVTELVLVKGNTSNGSFQFYYTCLFSHGIRFLKITHSQNPHHF